MDPFREEFDLMAALCARGLRLALAPAAGVRVEVVNRYATDAEGRSMLPDLAYGSEAWALLRLTVPRAVVETEAGTGGDIHLLTAHLAYGDLDGRQHRSEPVHLRLPRLPAAAFSAVAANAMVASRASELEAAQLQEAGRVAAQRGDWSEVERLLGELRALATDNPWLKGTVAELERYAKQRETQAYSKEAHYTAQKMRSRLAAREESPLWSLSEEAAKPSFLRRKAEQGKRLDAPKDDKDRSGA
jgi:Ca-activated chloride channel family protein